MKLFLALLIGLTALTALARPWIGIAAYYLLAILGPQYIWWWNFDETRISLIVAIFTITGIAIKLLVKDYDASFLWTKLNIWIIFLWLCIDLSYVFSSDVNKLHYHSFSPAELFSTTNKMFFFYFCAVFVIDSISKLRNIQYVIVVSTLYLTFWANNQYFTQNWGQFNFGRLMGPTNQFGASIYNDENTFAMLFVTGMPFIYYMAYGIKEKWLRYMLWATVPFIWHAVFLTGSRGGLLGIGAVTLLIVLNSNKKFLALPMLTLFIVFYVWQAGETMKQRSETISNYAGESSAEARLTLWTGAMRMIADNPIIGVGLGSFITAVPSYIETKPRVAHNTLLQYTAESGIGAGIAFLAIIRIFLVNSIKIHSWCTNHNNSEEKIQLEIYNNSSMVSFAGLIVCSFFLSLNTYEVFYFLFIFNNLLYQIYLRNNNNTICPSTA